MGLPWLRLQWSRRRLYYSRRLDYVVFTPYLLCPGGEVEAGVLCIPGLARSPGLCSWPPAQSEALALHPQPELGALAACWLWARCPVLKQRAVISRQRNTGSVCWNWKGRDMGRRRIIKYGIWYDLFCSQNPGTRLRIRNKVAGANFSRNFIPRGWIQNRLLEDNKPLQGVAPT